MYRNAIILLLRACAERICDAMPIMKAILRQLPSLPLFHAYRLVRLEREYSQKLGHCGVALLYPAVLLIYSHHTVLQAVPIRTQVRSPLKHTTVGFTDFSFLFFKTQFHKTGGKDCERG